MDTVFSVLQLLSTGYCEAMLLIALIWLLWKRQRQRLESLLIASNQILLYLALVRGVMLGGEIFFSWYDQTTVDQTVFVSRMRGVYWYTYWLMFLVPVVAPQVFWFRKMRRSLVVSLVMIPMLEFGFITELVVIYITRHYRDFRPAGWTFYPPSALEICVPLGCFVGVMLGVYWVRRWVRRRVGF